MRIAFSLEFNQKVSSTLSILLILLLSTLVALLTLKAAEDIVTMAQTSPLFHPQQEIPKNLDGLDVKDTEKER